MAEGILIEILAEHQEHPQGTVIVLFMCTKINTNAKAQARSKKQVQSKSKYKAEEKA